MKLLPLFSGLCAVVTWSSLGAAPVQPAVPDRAPALPLDAVRVTGGPLKQAQDLDRAYLLQLDPDRMLYYLRLNAGLQPKADRGNGGWDAGKGKWLTGHIAGHYLSAVSLMWAATGDPRFKERADYIVSELKEIQAKHGDGYIGAITDAEGRDGKKLLEQVGQGDIRSGGFDLNGLWSPWYVQHKLYAGLRDAYRFTGNRDALEIEIAFAAWAERILAPLSPEQVQRMLNTEFGGMNEIAIDLYEDTGDKRWLALAEKFEHTSITEPLSRGVDILPSKHGNTQVPKLLGSLARYTLTGNKADGDAALFFWERVVFHHSFATGGHGRNEYFGQPDVLDPMIDGRTAETCNVYNMVKYTRRLFALQPQARFAEFQERALFNHILGSIDPHDGWTCYMVPVGRGVTREYESNMVDGGFTCCVGSGMESHALHGAGLYYGTKDTLWVTQFVPSVATWRDAGVRVEMKTDFPEGESATLTLNLAEPKKLTLNVRRPSWAGDGFEIALNGKPLRSNSAPGSFIELNQTWKDGDTVTLKLPKALRLEPLPDNPRRAALVWGPLVLAGDLGPGAPGEMDTTKQPKVPVFIAAEKPLETWLKPVEGRPGVFKTDGVGVDHDVEFTPFYRLHRRTYAAYWDLFTPEEWQKRKESYLAAEQRRQQLEAATVANFQPGEMQPETDFKFTSAESTIVRVLERAGRRGGAWFSLELPAGPAEPLTLLVTTTNDEGRPKTFDVLVNGVKIGSHTTERRSPEQIVKLYDLKFEIPESARTAGAPLTVRFEAAKGQGMATLHGVRLVRTTAAP